MLSLKNNFKINTRHLNTLHQIVSEILGKSTRQPQIKLLQHLDHIVFQQRICSAQQIPPYQPPVLGSVAHDHPKFYVTLNFYMIPVKYLPTFYMSTVEPHLYKYIFLFQFRAQTKVSCEMGKRFPHGHVRWEKFLPNQGPRPCGKQFIVCFMKTVHGSVENCVFGIWWFLDSKETAVPVNTLYPPGFRRCPCQ